MLAETEPTTLLKPFRRSVGENHPYLCERVATNCNCLRPQPKRLLTYLKHRITNAASETIDSRTATIITKNLGVWCFASTCTGFVLFHGKLDLSCCVTNSRKLGGEQ
jgi:hypothetical protein